MNESLEYNQMKDNSILKIKDLEKSEPQTKQQTSFRRIHIQPMSIENNSKETTGKNSSFVNNSITTPVNKISRQTTLAQDPPKKKRVRFADEDNSDLCVIHEIESYKDYNSENGTKAACCCQVCGIY